MKYLKQYEHFPSPVIVGKKRSVKDFEPEPEHKGPVEEEQKKFDFPEEDDDEHLKPNPDPYGNYKQNIHVHPDYVKPDYPTNP